MQYVYTCAMTGFQSTFPRGERRVFFSRPCPDIQFQSTFPRGERQSGQHRHRLPSGFNPRSHEGNDLNVSRPSFSSSVFQSTFPRGERPYVLQLVLKFCQFQSTFPRGERQSNLDGNIAGNGVSIHVPTRGTTHGAVKGSCGKRVSIHVPTRGTTAASRQAAAENPCFNPRSHEGNDTKMRFYEANLDVSIHVPTRGTTWSRNDDQLRISGFNPRSHEGNDPIAVLEWSQGWSFNPRSHEGNDEGG